MRLSGFLFVFLLLISITSAFGQSKKRPTTIKGTVTDSDGNPVDGVQVTVGSFFTLTDEAGNYELDIYDGDRLIAGFINFAYIPDTVMFSIQKGELKVINKQIKLRTNMLADAEVQDRKSRFEGGVKIDPRTLESYAGTGSAVEGILKSLPGVNSNNELSSQISVRGGSFDENQIYINGIEVYRSFLVSNGQQEGLSIINPNMVENIDFSAGGFEARYGDKMSSVLDITYRKPTEFGLAAEASLLGGSLTYEDRLVNDRLAVLVGGRYRTNQLLLGSLDTEADFRPRFTDIQAYLNYTLTDEWDISFLGNYSKNLYQVIPSTRNTDFGTFQEALRLTVFFDGQEDYDFTTRFGALSAVNRPSNNLELKYTASVFQTTEQEYFDVIGAYRLGELNNNLGSDDFGEISFIRGVGGFQNYARNNLDIIVANAAHDGLLDKGDVSWRWGLKYQYEDIIDRYKEWEMIDSAGYSIPHKPSFGYDSLIVTQDTIIDGQRIPLGGVVYSTLDTSAQNLTLFESYNSSEVVQSSRIMAYVERSQLFERNGHDFFVNLGLRAHYWTFNNQTVVSPRLSFSWHPDGKRDMVWRLASGLYYQPPFYREMRNLEGGLNEDIRAQRSMHFVLGNDYQLKLWNRPFKMVTEVYYKDYNSLIPYDMDNVRIRYRAENNSKGYAAGIDYRINGEFVNGVDSWFSLSLLKVEEDIQGDGAGYVPRPTDQRFSAKVFFQDYLPRDPTFRVSLTGTYATGLPFGPPQAEPKDKDFRIPAYRRVDIGFSKVLKLEGKTYKSKFLNTFSTLYVTLEVFNLLATNNTVSYLWIKDISTAREYAVPNYLTGRLLNLKLVAKF